MMRSASKKEETDKTIIQSASNICNALYLTQPGKLWSNHPEFTDGNAFRQKMHKEVQHNLALHTPRRESTALHSWLTWGVWVDGYSQQDENDISSILRMEWQSATETFANTRTDSILDEYIKTCKVPLRGKQYSFRRFQQNASLKQAKARAYSHKRSPDKHSVAQMKRKTIDTEDNINNEDDLSPFDVCQNVKQYNTFTKKLQTKYNKKQFVTQPPQKNNSGPTIASKYDFTTHPIRLEHLQIKNETRPSPCSSHPWYQASGLWERLELFLESKYTQTATSLKTTEYKTIVETVLKIVRQVITRGQSALEFQHHCEESLDLLDVAPTFENFMKRTDYVYTTTNTLLTDFYKSVQMLFGSSEKHMKGIMMLVRVLQPHWDKLLNAQNSHNQIDVALLHKIMSHIDSSHSNEVVRKKYVARFLPKNTIDSVVSLYANRYEQIVRAHYMSESSFRKEQNILTVAYSLLQLPSAYVLHQTQQFTHHTPNKELSSIKSSLNTKNTHFAKQVSSKTKTLRIKLNTKDRVPQKVAVHQKKVRSRSISKKTTPVMMVHPAGKQHTVNTTTTTSSPLPSTSKLSETNTHANTQIGGAKKSSDQNKSRTITLVTLSNNHNTNKPTSSVGQVGQKKKKKKQIISISKTKPANLTARYLTTREVETYRSGLKKYIKEKGGEIFVTQLQQTQQKKHPDFELQDVIPVSSVHHTSIQKKLKLSAKNRNALRRVKRSVLHKYGGGGHTVKQNAAVGSRNSRLQENQLQDSKKYTGSLYTRKHSGGSSNTTPRITWNDTDSLGDTLRDTSQTDMANTSGVTSIDLANLDSVELLDI